MVHEHDPYADHPVHEEYVRPGTEKEAFERRMKEREDAFVAGERVIKCRCGYEFRESPGRRLTRCPYCGRGADALSEKPSAQDLLDDARDDE